MSDEKIDLEVEDIKITNSQKNDITENLNNEIDKTIDNTVDNTIGNTLDNVVDNVVENTIDDAVDDTDSDIGNDIEMESIDLSLANKPKYNIQKLNYNFDEKKYEKEENGFVKFLKVIWEYGKIFIVAAILAVFINTFIIVNANVPTGSMENTIATEGRIIGLRLSYLFSEPERGDIIVFENPFNPDENYVKRVIGLPGERVEIVNAEIYIYNKNGDVVEGPLDEPYLKEVWKTRSDGYVFNVPEGCYLTFGDNRNSSYDARGWKDDVEANPSMYNNDHNIIYIKKEKIIGKVYLQYWNHGLTFDWIDGKDVNY